MMVPWVFHKKSPNRCPRKVIRAPSRIAVDLAVNKEKSWREQNLRSARAFKIKGFVIYLEDAAVRRVRSAGKDLRLPQLTSAKVSIRHWDHLTEELRLRPHIELLL